MNIIEFQEELEYWPDQKIHEEVMRPTGAANGQTYLVVLEAERRNKERQAYQAALATQQQPKPTVVQETMMEFGGGQPMGGVPDVDPNMMQNQMMPQQQMPQQMPQGQPMAMKAGGAIRHQGGEDVGNPLFGRGGSLFDYTNPWDYALAGMMLAPIPGSRVAASAIKAGRLGKAALASRGAKGVEEIGKTALKRGFKPNYGGAQSIPMSEVGTQVLKAPIKYINPKTTEFRTRTLPAGAATAFVGTRGADDADLGIEADASAVAKVSEDEITRLQKELERIQGMSPEEIQAERDKKKRDEEIAATIAADKEAKDLAEETERDRRAALPDSARMLEDAMANVPENQTFQDYLSTLEGMEESRKSQVLMDLGAAIANASHGGDIAKGFQEAGTKARAEKIEVAKERARVLGESRAMDLDVALKMATIEADLEKQTGRTLQELLALLQMNEDFIIDNYPESAESIMQQIRAAIEVSLPQVTEQATE